MPCVAQGGLVLRAPGQPHAGGSAFQRQPLAPGAGPAGLLARERLERAQGGAGTEGGVGVGDDSAVGQRPGRDDRRENGNGGGGVEANQAFLRLGTPPES